jgi:nucleoside-diphosphate-sugar epimerase
VREYHRVHGLATVIVRPPMLYGPGQPERQTRLMRIVRGGRPPVFGDGRNRRSIAYVDNVVAALLLAAEHPAAVGRTYWIADERPYTTLEILHAIADALDVKLRPLHLPLAIARACELADRALVRVGRYWMAAHVVGESPHDSACSIQRAQSELGYRPAVAVAEGMRRAVQWCRAQVLL